MNRKFKISRITLLLMCLCLVFLFSCGEENEKNEVRVETDKGGETMRVKVRSV